VKVIQGQGEINIGQLEGLVQRGIVSKYELIPLTNKAVMTNVKVFGCSRRSFRGQGKKNTDKFEDLVLRGVVSEYE
jgi:hypothetical protein